MDFTERKFYSIIVLANANRWLFQIETDGNIAIGKNSA